MNRVFTHVSVIMMCLLLMTGCQALTGKTAGTTVDDTMITSSVKTKLAGDSMSSLTRIDVDTDRGVVTLNGIVESAQAKTQAENLAGQVSGVQRVVNNLQIESN